MTPLSFTLYFLISLAGLSQTYPFETQTCYDDHGNFTSGSAYEENRDAVLRSLSPNVTAQDGFYATNTGESPNAVYAITFCRGDASADECGICVRSGVEYLAAKCPDQRAAYSMYYMHYLSGEPPCIIRYSDTPIYGKLEEDPATPYYNTGNLTMDLEKFRAIWRNFTQRLAIKAANGSSKLKYAADQVELPDNQTIYSHTQCSPDLTPYDCKRCLFSAIEDYDSCCRGKSGGGVDRPSCIFRWDLYPFLEAKLSPPSSQSSPPLPAVLPPSAAPPAGGTNIGKGTLARIIVLVAVFVVLLFIGYCCLRRRQTRKKYETVREESGVSEITSLKSLQFNWDNLLAATDKFSLENKLGEGGFGEVYQGRLPDGQEIAVKRLSQSSRQGVQEFMNEIALVAKLEHRNLVRLLGFCMEKNEKLLIYEFVPNKSLDYFLFDLEKIKQLDWSRRYKIISGIARGMLYLHEDSRLRVIHRDLKASNILLDNNMNPKISDFGMARIFRVDQNNANTRRIVGTYGNMSPEYAMHGQFSQKSDVYSFGILLLEIICGKRNNYYCHSEGGDGLTSYAWKRWRGGAPLEILDSALGESYSRNEVLRCIHISFLCVQEDPANRPTMASIVLALSSQTLSLPVPREPAFFLQSWAEQPNNIIGNDQGPDRITSGSAPLSVNEVTITEVYPR